MILSVIDFKVTNAEGFNKEKLFEILDGLERGTRPIMEQARKELAKRHGLQALQPWNMSYKMAGSIIVKMDPYFPFSKSVERYVRSYAALQIDYQGATMNLDLLDRPKKYSNGFCHWPQPAWIQPDGTWQPSVANFTSLADPGAVGSGLTALTTLMHEAGHAAHFANIRQPSPLYSQERAPTSVAYAENQSMFLDSLVSDAAWRAKYAHDDNGQPIPFDIIEEEIRATHPFAVFQLRAMLAVSYFEKALYELPEEQVTAEKVVALADEIEKEIQGGPSPRPLLSVPHLVSDEGKRSTVKYVDIGQKWIPDTVLHYCIDSLVLLSRLHAGRNVGTSDTRLLFTAGWLHCRQSYGRTDFDPGLLGMWQFSQLFGHCPRLDGQGAFRRCLGSVVEGKCGRQSRTRTKRIQRSHAKVQY